ncbi:beta-ketoacyl synthase N-terminal-like domain-containing protein [Chitinolyticbacter albus]|uniref:beta-ketoacyl synthase N-terminal-like domain-containing protein n=1 Tax=Chitinolyticbacter albus TaxID=2961951 RepID=UPI00210BE5E3|nr:beta-ketoacyl synthase N-terminal-like domain-containing protein [Chitinolyticbacter albus]
MELLEQAAQQARSDTGYVFLKQGDAETARLGFASLAERAKVIAAGLQSRHCAGERVLLLYPPGIDFVVAMFACFYAGAIAVPLYPPVANRNMDRLNAIAADCQARFVFTLSEIVDEMRAGQMGSSALDGLDWIATDVDLAEPSAWRAPLIDLDTVAYLQYTSGSTSQPKGVVITHANAVHNCALLIDGWEVTPGSVMVSWLPHFHDFGLVSSVLMPVLAHIQAVTMPPAVFVQRPIRWLRAIERYRGTHTGAPNFAYQLCVDRIAEADRAQLDLSSLRVAVNGAEPIRVQTIRDFVAAFAVAGLSPNAACPGYGLAESVLKVSTASPALPATEVHIDGAQLERGRIQVVDAEQAGSRQFMACGVPRAGVDVRIVNPQTLLECAADEVGEIWVSSPSVASVYWGRDEESQVFHARMLGQPSAGRYLRTGDLGFLHHGEVVCAGRIKDLIIIRGGNHYPQDIEATVADALAAYGPGAGAAFAVEHDGEERLVVVQGLEKRNLPSDDHQQIVLEVTRALAERHGLELQALVLVPARNVPRTSSGKIQRAACRRAYQDDALSALFTWSRPVLTPEPALLAGADSADVASWLRSRVAHHTALPVGQIKADEPFSSFGIDSARIVAISGEIGERYGIELEASLLFSYPTIDALARYLTGQGDAVRPGAATARLEEEIAVIGLGCRFPGAHGPDQFWQLVRDGEVAVGEIPVSRWDGKALFDADPQAPGKINTLRGGFVDDVDCFDADFFKISPREAARMDPQQRLLLETVWEALEHAGIVPASLAGSQTGVFVGMGAGDYALQQLSTLEHIDGHAATGNSHGVAAGRLSYLLDLHGPSLAIDTACSSSLVAVHLACRSLRDGECDLAIVAGVNLLLRPEWSVALSKAGMLSEQGWCKAFDAEASGYVRSEGVGVVILRRQSEAVAAGDPIRASLLGSAVNQDGRSNGLTAPNGLAQQAVVRRALQVAGVEPAAIHYLEAHGTGTPLGDPVEVAALKAVLSKGRTADTPCSLGAVKANIGHLEAAAGIAGLIKACLVLQHRQIPPCAQFETLNPQIRLDDAHFEVSRQTRPFPAAERHYAGVSAFSFAGTNAHAVLASAPTVPEAACGTPEDEFVLPVSAHSEGALQRQVARYAAVLADPASRSSLRDLCFTAAIGRTHFAARVAFVGLSKAELVTKMTSWLSDAQIGAADDLADPQLVFACGDAAARPGETGSALFRDSVVYRDAFMRCAAAVQHVRGVDLLVARSEECAPGAEEAQLHAFATGYALYAQWAAWGVRADLLLACGGGVRLAACLAGAISLHAALAPAWPEQLSPLQLPLLLPGQGLIAAGTACEVAWLAEAESEGAAQAVQAVASFARAAVLIDLAPGEALTQASAQAGADVAVWPCLVRGRSEWFDMGCALAALYRRGYSIDWPAVAQCKPGRRVALPTYSFERVRHWLDTPAPRPSGSPAQPDATPAISVALFQQQLAVLNQQLAVIEQLK